MSKSKLLALALLIATNAARPEPDSLGRLFFTPAERAALDRHRRLQPEMAQGPTLTVNGTVHRSTGRRTTWVNGNPVNENEPLPGKLSILKVGETLHPDRDERSDLLAGGTLSISRHPSPPAPKP